MSEPGAEPVVLAFDGGSTKTDVLLASRSGDVLGRGRVGPSNHQLVGVEAMLAALAEAIEVVVADAALEGPTHLGESMAPPLCDIGVFCLAGIDLPIDESTITPAIEARGWTVRTLVHNDTLAVSRAGSTRSWGIGVVCGTGVNCAAIGPGGAEVRFPALAELSGDFAPGGSWLGVRALGLALRAGDGRGEATSLQHLVPAYLDQPDAEAVLTGVYTGAIPYNRLFELASVLLQAASDGDAVACQAADMLADEVVAFIRAAVHRLGLEDRAVEVVLGGGVFDTEDDGFHRRITDGVHSVAPNAQLVHLAAPPVLGAALLGLDALGATDAARERLRAAVTTS